MKTFYLFQLGNPIEIPPLPCHIPNCDDTITAPIDSGLEYLLFIGLVLAIIVLYRKKQYKF